MARYPRRGFLAHAASLPAVYWSARALGQTTPAAPTQLTVDGQISPPPPGPIGGPVDVSIVPALGRTVWNPGIYGGVPPDNANPTSFPNGVGPATQHGSTLNPSGGDDRTAIQNALNAAAGVATKASRRYVKLGAGTFRVGGSITIPSYVILRGTIAADGFTRATIIRNTHDGHVFNMTYGSENASGNWGQVRNIVGSTVKDGATITVNDASNINVGDIVKIDTLTDGTQFGALPAVYNPPNPGNWCWFGDHKWFVRQPYSNGVGSESLFPDSSPAPGWRHVTENHEVLAKNGNVLTVYDPNAPVIKGSPCRSPMYRSPQLYRCAGARADVRRYAGIEDLKIEPNGPGGRWVIEINQAAFCWVKNVEIDGDGNTAGSWTGRQCHLREQTYRCEVRDCYFHDSDNYTPGGNSYGIQVAGSENYIHNNVVVQHTKPIIFEASSGGNVVAFNYVDKAIIGLSDGWQEYGIGTHASFCHYELIEGNWTPNMGPDCTHGNNGWMTYFRNYARGLNSGGVQTGPIRCFGPGGWQRELYCIGNVMLDPALAGSVRALIEDRATNGPGGYDGRAVYLMGWASWYIGRDAGYNADDWDNGQTGLLFHRHLDFDSFSNSQYNNATNPVKALPDSLHRATVPDYFTGYTWPWVNPAAGSHATRVLTLPAKARYDAGRA